MFVPSLSWQSDHFSHQSNGSQDVLFRTRVLVVPQHHSRQLHPTLDVIFDVGAEGFRRVGRLALAAVVDWLEGSVKVSLQCKQQKALCT
jgi:hypothetical protein